MSVEIRRAHAKDAPFLAWVMLAAARSHLQRGSWDVSLDLPEEETLAFLELLAVTGQTHLFHYSTFVVAEVDGRSAAALCGYAPRAAGMGVAFPAIGDVSKKLGRSDADRKAGMKRVEPFFSCAPEEPDGAWIIENVATSPDFRRRGLIDILLRRILDEGRGQGFELAQIGVLVGNTPAQRAYEKAGFEVVDEKRTPEFEATFGCPGIKRLQQRL